MKKFIIVVVVLLVGNVIFWIWGPGIISYSRDRILTFQPTVMQAVYLNDGTIYVGHIQNISKNGLVLANTYNVRVDAGIQDQGGQSESVRLQSGSVKNVALLKWGFYQPLQSKGIIHINNSSILFWETLNADSEVVKQIRAARVQ